MPGPFLKLFTDILDDPDLMGLPDDVFGGWIKMLLSVKRCNERGALPVFRRLAAMLKRDEDTVRRYLNRWIADGLVDEDFGQFVVHNWAKWQQEARSPNAVRSAAWREEQKAAKQNPPSALPQERNTEEESRCASARENNKRSRALAPPPTATTDSPLQETEEDEVCRLASELGGDIGWATWASSRLRMGDKPAAIKAAISEAVNKGKLNTSYVGSILARYARDGIPDPPPAKAVPRAGPGQTNQPGGPTPEQAARIDAELAVKPRMTRAQWEAQQRERDRAKGA